MEALANTHPNYAISLNGLGRAVEHGKTKKKTSDQYNLNPKNKIYAMSNNIIISQFWNRIL